MAKALAVQRQPAAEVKSEKFLTRDQEFSLIKRWQENEDYDARSVVICKHQFLVKKIVWQFRGYIKGANISVEDLISVGNFGLMEAISRFDLNREFRFSTYGQFWVKIKIQEYVRQNAHSVKFNLTPEEKQALRKISKLTDINDEALDRIATEFDLSRTNIDMLRYMATNSLVLSANALTDPNNEETVEFLDLLVDESEGEKKQTEMRLVEDRKKVLRQLMAEADLNQKEAIVAEQRWLRDEPATLREVASTLKISAEGTRLLERTMFGKLRRAARRLRLKPEDMFAAA